MLRLSQPRWRNLGPLRAIELPAAADSPTIICMHGYGANAQDLLPIGMELDLAGPARWLFPRGPLTLDAFGPDARAWFPIDEKRLVALQTGGAKIDVSQERSSGFDAAVKAAEEMLAALEVPMPKVIFGGFSQGAMMAVELASRAAEKPLGLFILSGTLVDEPGLKQRLPKLKGLKFFQSHGSADPILDFKTAVRLQKTLETAGLDGEFLRFEGPHSVPQEVIAGLQRYLNALLPKAGSRP